MTRRSGGLAAITFLALALAGIPPLHAKEVSADPHVAHLIEAQDLAEAGEAKHDFQLLVQAACARAQGGELATIDIEHRPDHILSDQEDDLSVDRLLTRAAVLAPATERPRLEAARADVAAGRPPSQPICGAGGEALRGTGYVVRLVRSIAQKHTLNIDLPALKPDEPIVITVHANSFGRISLQLLGPKGVLCTSTGAAAQTTSCTAPAPGGAKTAVGYRLRLNNDANLTSKMSIYVS